MNRGDIAAKEPAPASPGAAHGPLRNATIVGALILLLATVMLLDSLLLPLPGAQYADFNRLSLMVTGGLFAIAALSLALHLAGWRTAGRLGMVLYGCLLIGAMTVIMGPDTGVDVLGTVALVFAPALIFGVEERWKLGTALALSVGTSAALQVWHMGGGAPLVPIEADFLATVRLSVVFVAACTGILMIYQHRSAEAARAAAAREHQRSESLLLNILPARIAARLKAGEARIADSVGPVTVLFADIVGFSRYAAGRTAPEVVDLLDGLFSRFDAICADHGLEKIKTIGDGYLAVAGLPTGMQDGAAAAARAAIAMQAVMAEVRSRIPELDLRIGLHTGTVVAGVIGARKFAYDIWGDTVNTASRIESASRPGSISLSAETAGALGDGFRTAFLGEMELKGVGRLAIHCLLTPGEPDARGTG